MYIIIFLVILLSCFIIFFEEYIFKTYFDGIEVKKSPIAGNGVFATKNFIVGEIVEIAPIIKEHEDNMKGLFNDYQFRVSPESSENGIYALALGYGGVYNHSDNHNVAWKISGNKIIITAIKPIKKGEEIFLTYGQDYWDSRDHVQKE